MKIQTVSRKTGLSAHTLRYYEKIGLLINVKRDPMGHRYYSAKDLVWIEFIIRLKATDMPLTEIRQFAGLRISGDQSISERVALLKNHQARVEKQMQKLQSHHQKITEKIALCKKGGELS